ncbi:expressed protein, partial [Phakopsora pachyrhizi]
MNLSFNKNLNTFIVVCTVLYISTTLGGYRSLEDFGDLSRGLLESSDAGSSQVEPNPSFRTVPSLLGRVSSVISDISRGAFENVANVNQRIYSYVTYAARDKCLKSISERVCVIENYISFSAPKPVVLHHVKDDVNVDLNEFETTLALKLTKVFPDLIKMIEEQVYIIPDNIQGKEIGYIIHTLPKVMLDKKEVDPDFMAEALKTFQLYAKFTLKDVNLEFENHRISLLIDLMRIFCAIFGREGTEKLTESNETLIILAKGIQPIIKGLFDRGKIQNIWELESYKTILAYSQFHPLNSIFRNIDRLPNQNKWDSLLHEYITLEFKDLNNKEINHLLGNTLIFSKSSEIPENKRKQITNTLLHNLLSVKSLPTLQEIQKTPGEVRVYFSLFWLSKYLTNENNISIKEFSQNQSYQLYRFLKGFILVYSKEENSPYYNELAEKYFLSNNVPI